MWFHTHYCKIYIHLYDGNLKHAEEETKYTAQHFWWLTCICNPTIQVHVHVHIHAHVHVHDSHALMQPCNFSTLLHVKYHMLCQLKLCACPTSHLQCAGLTTQRNYIHVAHIPDTLYAPLGF